MRVWIGMTGRMAKYWIIPKVGDKKLPHVGHQLASCSLLISYVLIHIFQENTAHIVAFTSHFRVRDEWYLHFQLHLLNLLLSQ